MARGFVLGCLIRNTYATRNIDIVGKLPSPWLGSFVVTAYVTWLNVLPEEANKDKSSRCHRQ